MNAEMPSIVKDDCSCYRLLLRDPQRVPSPVKRNAFPAEETCGVSRPFRFVMGGQVENLLLGELHGAF